MAKIPIMITKAMASRLRAMGYGQKDIDGMEPQQADEILQGKSRKPEAEGPAIPFDPRASRQPLPKPPLTVPTDEATAAEKEEPVLDSEARWRKLLERPDEAATDDPAGEPDESVTAKPATPRAGPKFRDRTPLRPQDTMAQERARYPGRMARWEEAKALVESRKGHEGEDIAHRTTCPSPSTCQDPAHVVPRREWSQHTKHDLRHLGACDKEDVRECPDKDVSHLLPPRPVDVETEHCCRRGCFPKADVRSLTECISIRVPDRAQRELELKTFGRGAFTVAGSGGDVSLVVHPLGISEETNWAWGASRTIRDDARVAPPEE